jgi:hypothetical protein
MRLPSRHSHCAVNAHGRAEMLTSFLVKFGWRILIKFHLFIFESKILSTKHYIPKDSDVTEEKLRIRLQN